MAYTTTALVKASLGIPTATTSEDTAIAAAIDAAEALINNYTGRTFETVTESRTFIPRTASILDIDDLATLSGLTIKTDEDQNGSFENTLVDGTDFVMVGNTNPYRKVTQINQGWPLSIYGRPTVQVTGTWGFASSVPDNIKQAALLMSCRLFQRKASPLGFQAGAISEFGPVRISRQDPDVAALLHGMKLIGVA